MGRCEKTAGDPPQDSLPASGCVDEHAKDTHILIKIPKDTDEDVKRAFAEKKPTPVSMCQPSPNLT